MEMSMKLGGKLSAVLLSIPVFFNGLHADDLEGVLKTDFSRQETVKIHFEVNKRLYSFEAGKFKLEKIKRNRDKIRDITERIVPWAIMEHMTPQEVARIIVYMYHADEAGVLFMDSEDLIPLIASHDVPFNDFILMVQYNKETKIAGIPEEIREAFLGYSFSKGWDGMSILAGGRGLVMAKSSGLDINKTASLLLKRLPARGIKAGPLQLILILKGIIGEGAKDSNSENIINNIQDSYRYVTVTENSPAGLKGIVKESSRVDNSIAFIGGKNISDMLQKNDLIDKEAGIITDEHQQVPARDWHVLIRNEYYGAIKPWLGTPYRFGNKTGRPGIDCSGFTYKVLTNSKVGVPGNIIGHGSRNQCKAGKAVNREKLRAGDLVFFSASPNKTKITHVGLVTSPGYFAHASSSRGVVNDELNKKWWRQRYVAGRRIFSDVIK